MKKIFISLLLVLSMLSLTVTAYAEDVTTGSMTVNYEYTAPEGGGTGDTSTYTINIPATVTNENLDVIPITVSKNNIPTGKKISVFIDWDKSYDSMGSFKLYKNEESITCRVMIYTDSALTNLVYVDCIPELRGNPVAEFNAGSTSPSHGGVMSLNPLTQNIEVSSGTYTGTLYFNIEVTDAS
ncbi:MAG: hypothetical protein PHE09_09295 [Oscillospiraceae bacterium]|nr:hypothetical protein [Oscillospiraceae bacterium]